MFHIKRILALLIFLFGLELFSLDLNLLGGPMLTIPFGSSSTPYYTVGSGFLLKGEAELYDSYTAGAEMGIYIIPLKNTDTTTIAFAPGFRGGYFSYPSSRLRMQYNLSLGIYNMGYEEQQYSDFWMKLNVEGGYRFSPEIILTGSLAYVHLFTRDEPMYTGISASILFQYKLDTQKGSGKLEVELDQPEPVFPIYSSLYKTNSIGTLTLENQESAEITDVSVYFRAGNYTSSMLFCGGADILEKYGTIEIPLLADFSETIQNFTEEGKIPGEVVVEYKLLGSEREASQSLVLPVYNRNSVRWLDPNLMASFISPNSPEVLDYAKFMVGLARNHLRTGLNREMQFAMFLFEGLKVGGVEYSFDETTPYTTYHQDPNLIDYVQYPFQTLAYQSGDYDDLGLLMAGSLEAVGIRAALIPLKDDFIVAFALDMDQNDAENLFNDTSRLLNLGGDYWIPLSMKVIREGFINSWYRAIDSLGQAIASNESITVVSLQDAWKTYPPSGVTGSEAQFQKPQEARVVRSVETDLMRYITAEFGPKIQLVRDEIEETGGSRTLYNRLGLLYVRAGMYEEAKEEFRKSSELDSVTARVNLGNIALLEEDLEEAEKWYTLALELNPESPSALNGWDRLQAELLE